MKYTIISSLTNYGVTQIKPFVESINKSGYSGEKLMLVYNVSADVIEYLNENGWMIVQSEQQQHIILQRFRDMYALLWQYEQWNGNGYKTKKYIVQELSLERKRLLEIYLSTFIDGD